jgi:hypothetical protein
MKSFAFAGCFCLMITIAQAQCGQKIEMLSIDKEGKVEIKITANNSFKGTILLDDMSKKTPVKTFSGQGVKSFIFKLPRKDATYYVDVDFANEEKFLCKRKTKILDLSSSK